MGLLHFFLGFLQTLPLTLSLDTYLTFISVRYVQVIAAGRPTFRLHGLCDSALPGPVSIVSLNVANLFDDIRKAYYITLLPPILLSISDLKRHLDTHMHTSTHRHARPLLSTYRCIYTGLLEQIISSPTLPTSPISSSLHSSSSSCATPSSSATPATTLSPHTASSPAHSPTRMASRAKSLRRRRDRKRRCVLLARRA